MCERTHTVRTPARVLALALSLAAGAMIAARPARAHEPLPLQIHDEVHDHVREVLRHLGRIPDRTEAAHARHLEVFFGGRQYYGPHRHQHVTYLFPVWIDGAVEYETFSSRWVARSSDA